MNCKLLLLLVAVTFTIAVAGQDSPAAGQPAQSAPNQATASTSAAATANIKTFGQREPRYELRPGDVLELGFEFSPEFNQTVAVQPDGFVSLKGVGDIHVGGQTVPELRSTLNTVYKRILADPVISIVLKDFEKPYFIASGMVGHPGKYELRGDTTVTEALAIAGGLNESSKHSQVYLYRKVSDQWMEGKVLNIKKMLASRDLREDMHLQPGDMLYVPQNSFSKFKRFIPVPGIGMAVNATTY